MLASGNVLLIRPLVYLALTMCFAWHPLLHCNICNALELIDQLDSHLEGSVSIILHSDEKFENVKLLKVSRTAEGKIKTLRFRIEGGGLRILKGSLIHEVLASSQSVFRQEKPKIASRNSSKQSTSRPKQKRKPRVRISRADRKKQEDKAKKQRAKEEHKKWLGRLKARGIEPWIPETKEQHEAAIAGYREKIAEVIKLVPDMQLYETEKFLFCSNLPAQKIAPYVKILDEMYNWMCDTYGLKRDAQVWLGKGVVFVFKNREQYVAYQQRHYQFSPPEGNQGFCNYDTSGKVMVSCYFSNSLASSDFGQLLVHETSHGFLFRYKTKVMILSWVNEGLAEYIGQKLVPTSKAVRYREEEAFKLLQKERNLGGNFFKSKGNIDLPRYGIASSMTRFLIEADAKKYLQFINMLKEGMPFEEALYGVYGITPEQLTAHYGKSIGIPDLTP